MNIRIGNGYDVHRLTVNRKLILGGVEIPFEKGLLGHSDADVLCHAIADAMLGACSLGDIGKHFPDNDDRFEGVSGEFILTQTNKICNSKGFFVSNVDSIVVCEKPKISEFTNEMCQNIAEYLNIDPENVNVKGTTEEKLGFTGSGEAISSYAVVLMEKCKIDEF